MSAKFRLTGSGTGAEAAVHTPTDYGHEKISGLVVYSHSLETGIPLITFFADEGGSVDQNVNAAAAGTLTGVHNGTDSILWTASAISGTWDFASTVEAHTGTKSIQISTTQNATASFTNAVDLIATSYSDLRFWLFITSWPQTGNKDITIQPYLNGAAVGSAVNVSNYADTSVQNAWELIDIPMEDFLISTEKFDTIVVTVVDNGGGPTISGYMDDIAFVAAGTSGQVIFSVAPPSDEIWVINRIKWTAVSTSSAIKPDEFFGIGDLTNGYRLSFSSQGQATSTFLASNFYDMVQYPNVSLNVISGVNSIFEVFFDLPQEQQVLVGRLKQSINLTIRDDLSSMQKFRAGAQGYVRRTI